MRKKRSQLWQLSDDELKQFIKSSSSLGEVLRKTGLVNKGGNINTLKRRLASSNITHNFPVGINSNKGRKFPSPKKIPLAEVLVEGSSYSRGHLKKRLIEEKLLKNECTECGLKELWNDKPIVLVLDHINGISNDNRLKNLRLLCPNCNSQTSTFAGRNLKYQIETDYCVCGEKKKRNRKFCGKNCYYDSLKGKPNLKLRKVLRPDKEVLKSEINSSSYVALGKKYGVSDTTIRKWVMD